MEAYIRFRSYLERNTVMTLDPQSTADYWEHYEAAVSAGGTDYPGRFRCTTTQAPI